MIPLRYNKVNPNLHTFVSSLSCVSPVDRFRFSVMKGVSRTSEQFLYSKCVLLLNILFYFYRVWGDIL